MAGGGARAGSGRHPKSETHPQEAPIEKQTNFRTALKWAMWVINKTDAPLEMKTRLAIAILPFQTPKLAEKSIGKKGERKEAAKQAASGRFRTPQAPRLAA